MVTGPIPRNPKATRPKANTAGASIRCDRPASDTAYPIAISVAIAMPIQKALKFPAVSPASTLSEAPPSREAVTISRTWADSVEVNTFTSAGITAPASVPQVMMSDSFHHSVVSPPRLGMST